MKKIIGYFVVFVFLAASSLGEARDFYPKIFADIAREADKSVVKVIIPDPNTPNLGKWGAGFSIAKGLIATAYHVVKEAPKIIVETLNGEIFPAEIIAGDILSDVAIIKIEESDIGSSLKPLKLGDSSKIEKGDIVVTIGHPFVFSWNLSVGVISAIRGRDGKNYYPLRANIQIDVAINPGNSGGPLLNLEGEVIGIVAAILRGGEGIAFAIPVNIVKELLIGMLEAPAQEKIK